MTERQEKKGCTAIGGDPQHPISGLLNDLWYVTSPIYRTCSYIRTLQPSIVTLKTAANAKHPRITWQLNIFITNFNQQNYNLNYLEKKVIMFLMRRGLVHATWWLTKQVPACLRNWWQSVTINIYVLDMPLTLLLPFISLLMTCWQSCWWIIIPAACLCGCLSSNLIIASSRLVTGLANDSGPDWGLSIPFSAHPYPSTLPESTPHSWQVRRVFLYGPFHQLCHTLCLFRNFQCEVWTMKQRVQ